MANEWLPERSIPDRSPGHAFISDRSSRLGPAHQGVKTRSCDLVWRVGTVDSATPYPDPSGGQAPRLAKSSTALHFLILPSAISLQFGTFRPWRAGIEVDWRAHFLTNDECGAGLAKGCREWRMRGCRSGLSRIGVWDMLS